jgi:predicted PurR-regulated permease PerM
MVRDNRSLLFLILYLGAIFTLAYLFKSYFTFLILGAILVILLDPVNKRVQEYISNRIVSSLLMTFVVILVILIPLGTIAYSIGGQIDTARTFVQNTELTTASDTVNEYLGTSIDFETIALDGLSSLQNVVTRQAPSIIGSFANIIINLFIMFFLIYYGFKEGDKLKESMFSLLPIADGYVDKIKERGHKVLYGTLYGQLVVSIIQGFLTGLSFWLFGLSGYFLWGFVTAIVAFLPLIGTPMVWFPAAVYLWFTSDSTIAVAFLLFNGILTMNIDNVIKPKLIGDEAKMHPLLVLLSILGGLNVFGFIGFIVGPVITAVCILMIQFYVKDFDPDAA